MSVRHTLSSTLKTSLVYEHGLRLYSKVWAETLPVDLRPLNEVVDHHSLTTLRCSLNNFKFWGGLLSSVRKTCMLRGGLASLESEFEEHDCSSPLEGSSHAHSPPSLPRGPEDTSLGNSLKSGSPDCWELHLSQHFRSLLRSGERSPHTGPWGDNPNYFCQIEFCQV